MSEFNDFRNMQGASIGVAISEPYKTLAEEMADISREVEYSAIIERIKARANAGMSYYDTPIYSSKTISKLRGDGFVLGREKKGFLRWYKHAYCVRWDE